MTDDTTTDAPETDAETQAEPETEAAEAEAADAKVKTEAPEAKPEAEAPEAEAPEADAPEAEAPEAKVEAEAVGGPVEPTPSGEAKPEAAKPSEGEKEAISPLALVVLVAILAVVIYSFTSGNKDNSANLPAESNPAKLLTEGNRIASSEGLKEALPYFVKAVKVDPGNLEAHAALGNALLRLGRAQEAHGYLQVCSDREPERYEFQLRYGMCLADLKKFGEARTALEKAHKLKPDALEPLYPLGFVCLLLRDPGASVGYLEPFVAGEKHPGRKAVALQWLSDALQRLGKRKEAIDALTRLTKLRPNDVTARLALQRQQISVEGFEATVKHAEARAAEKTATALDAYLVGTLLASHPDRSIEARTWLAKAVETGDKAWLAPRISLAQEEMRDGKLDEARKQLDGVIKLSPNNLAAKVLLADLERQAKRYAEAREIYEVVLSTSQAPRAHMSILNTYLDEGKAEDALAFARRAPAGEARNLLEAQAFQALGKFDEAEKAFRALIEKAGKQAGLQISWLGYLTYVYLEADKLKEARETFAKMESSVPAGASFPTEFFLWAGVAFHASDPEKAKAYWTKGAAAKKDYDQHAWKRRACALLLGKADAKSLRAAARLAGWETKNDALYIEGLARKLAGDAAGAKQVWKQGAATSRQQEFPARLIARALKN